jgi:hypothetical protein
MENENKVLELVTGAGVGTRLGKVAALLDDAILVVSGPDGSLLACDVLEPRYGGTPRLAENDVVLVVVPEGGAGRGVVLGRVCRPEAANAVAKAPPEEIVLEATKGLTLKVGEGSIALREDGKVLIKGRELVSHARGRNRIRGGSVAIN